MVRHLYRLIVKDSMGRVKLDLLKFEHETIEVVRETWENKGEYDIQEYHMLLDPDDLNWEND